jgi:three-Cys-motif partner protein
MSADQRSWIEKRIEILTEFSDEVFDVQSDIYNSFNTWSALKLILHSATVNMYTTVASEHFDDIFYIDTLAGSGVSEYGDEQCFLGSPIIASKAATEPFSKMYFVEGDLKKKRALEERLKFVFENPDIDVQEPHDYEVYHGDVNDKVDEIVNDIWEVAKPNPNFNHLGSIDNQGLDFDWESMERVGNLTGEDEVHELFVFYSHHLLCESSQRALHLA